MSPEIANRLTLLRKQHGLSQEELAAALNISRQAVSKWERAESSPDTDNLIALARLYHMSLDEIITAGTDDASQTDESAADNAQSSEDAVWRNLWRLFPYPSIIILVYPILGIAFHIWYPALVLVLTIPIYYGIWWFISTIKHREDK